MFIDIFGNIFQADFERAIALKSDAGSQDYLAGIAQQAQETGPNILEITKLYNFLNEMDRRRNTSWSKTFPWLIDEFAKYGLID